MFDKYRPRLIPILLLDHKKRLVKTLMFGDRVYIGDPFNVVRLFNEKEVDELCILDIDATLDSRAPDQGFLRELVAECFMPVSYGGGITRADHCRELNRIGIEKFIIGSRCVDLEFIEELASEFGSQAVVVCLDVKRNGNSTYCVIRSARDKISYEPIELACDIAAAGAGELLVQSVNLDGTRKGMDLDLISKISSKVSIPVIAAGGAGEVAHLVEGMLAGASAVGSGSAFCFIGRLRAVLISYPKYNDVLALMSEESNRLEKSS